MVKQHQDRQSAQSGNTSGIAMLIRNLFISGGELCSAEAYRALKESGRKTSYGAIQRIFYDLRQLSLIEFTRSEPGKAPIDKRYHRIIPSKENDPRWRAFPHHILYPASAVGGLNYEKGASRGRDKKYAKEN